MARLSLPRLNVWMHIWHGNKLRSGRRSLAGQIYLITTSTFNRQTLFADPDVGALVAAEIFYADRCARTRNIAFVVMPDHVHWLFELPDNQQLSSVIRIFKGRSSRSIRKLAATHQKVWQKGFHDRALRHSDDVDTAANYVISNPVRAGLVEAIADYQLWWMRHFECGFAAEAAPTDAD
jgi:putative transposase